MSKKLIVIVFFSFVSLYAGDEAYVRVNNDEISIGNKYIERIIEVKPDKASTIKIVNKESKTIYNVNSDEFAISVVFAFWGPAYSKDQNGENPALLTSKDFYFKNYKTEDLNNGGKGLVLHYGFKNKFSDFTVGVIYKIFPDNSYMKKWVEISDSDSGIQFLDKIYPESLTFSTDDFSHGQYGQPVFNQDIFLGVEYPTTENKISPGKVMCGYIVGEKITNTVYKSHPSVLGVAPSSPKLEQTFMDYIDKIKVKGTRQFLLYNTWYDLRPPFLVHKPENILNERNVLDRINSFKKGLSTSNIKLDAFVIDLGWDNFTAKWDVDSVRFPRGFSYIAKSLDSINVSLGLWASPWGGYEERDQRVKWAIKNGYETSGDFLCFAGKKYYKAMKSAMIRYTKKYNIGYFKWDGLSNGCNELNHGHLPGIYSHEAIVSNFINMIKEVRKVNPNIFINITIGTWLSPWWLKYADCVWMQGEDYGYAGDIPAINERDKAITYKDGVLWNDLQKQSLLFPTSSLMTHGIIKGSLNLLGGKNEMLDSFSNEVMMYFGRGVMMWELYLTPELVSKKEWESIASAVTWAKANKEVLKKTKMILGNPLKREPYGYIHLTKGKGILLLRNPNVESHEVKFKLSPNLGDVDSSVKYFVKIIYPYMMILPNPVGINQDIDINLDGYEILTAELIPSDSINVNLPVGIRYSINNGNLIVYDKAGSESKIESANKREIAFVNFNGVSGKINVEEAHSLINDRNEFLSTSRITVPKNFENAKVAFLLERKTAERDSSSPEPEILINGVKRKITIKQENGNWFWLFADLDQSGNKVSCVIKMRTKDEWKIGGWVFADEKLSSQRVESKLSNNHREILPASPYDPNICKTIISLNQEK